MGARRLSPGDELGKYRLERQLGAGGMGEVWAAHDPDLDRRVALKVLRPSLASDDAAKARLQREGRAMARLRHPNVITVHEAMFSDGRGVIAMELIEGHSLAQWLATRRDRDAIVGVLLAAGRGLAAAHDAAIVHRDFKPHNVLVDRDGRVVVTDFGLARATGLASADVLPDETPVAAIPVSGDDETVQPAAATPVSGDDATIQPAAATPVGADDETVAPALAETAATPSSPSGRSRRSDPGALHSPLTITGELLGTPAYMAPEQFTAGEVDARSDQFAFCVTAWEALTGHRPFAGRTLGELRDHVLHRPPGGADDVPGRLRSILIRGLSRAPGDRWPSMTALLRAIDRAWKRPRRILLGVGALGVVAGLVVGGVMLRRSPASPCVSADRALAEVWSPALRAKLVDRLGVNAFAPRVLQFFDGWRDRWTAIDRAICAQPSAPEYAARRACLDSLRDDAAIWKVAFDGLPAEIALRIDYPMFVASSEICEVNPRAVTPVASKPGTAAAVSALRREMIEATIGANGPFDDDDVDFSPFVNRARELESSVLIAEALLRQGEIETRAARTGADKAKACARSEAAASEAERAGADRVRTLALIQGLKCANIASAPLADRLKLAERLDSAAARLGDRVIRGLADLMLWQVDVDAGRWTAAIDRLERARATWREIRSPQQLHATDVALAEARRYRHLGDDHGVAMGRLLWWAPHLVDPSTRREATMVAEELYPLLWMDGDFERAAMFVDPDNAHRGERVDVTITVEGAVDDAEVIAAIEPDLDPTRLSMVEWDGPVESGRTDRSGTLALRAPVGGVIVAREAGSIAVAPVPAGGGKVVLRLRPGVPLSGTVTGFPAIATDDPALIARAARRQVPAIYATTWIGDRALTWHAPVSLTDGRWQIPMVVPGRYVVAADVTSALIDDQSAQTEVVVGATAPPPIALHLADPAIARVVVRPAIGGRVAIIPAGPLPRSWREAEARFAAAPALSMIDIGAALTRDQLIVGAKPGDAIVDVSVLTSVPAVVCVLPDAQSVYRNSLFRVIPGADKTPPICQEMTALDQPVIIETR